LKRAFHKFGHSATDEEVACCLKRKAFSGLYADGFLKVIGAKELVSVDCSDFEGATLLHDLNRPFPDSLLGWFDVVFDGGTLEHIFNYPEAVSRCLDLLKVGGHFIIITPASGQMGHGFYQFSPELFFRLFSPERGFALRKIIAFDCVKINSPFYEVKDPATTGERTCSGGNKIILLAILAQKTARTPLQLAPPQQSDYVTIWDKHRNTMGQTDGAKPLGPLRRLRITLNPYWPVWLMDFRNECRHYWNYGMSALKDGLTNRRHFRRVTNKEIFNERAGPVSTSRQTRATEK
jgi:hypothetical protein